MPRLGLTAGDPAGIGSEIVVKALKSEAKPTAAYTVYAEPALFDAECDARGLARLPRGAPGSAPAVLVPVGGGSVPADFAPGRPSAWTGRTAFESVQTAARDALAGRIDAMVTAPLAKSAFAMAGVPHPGHTELLAEIAGVPSVAMMFVAGDLRVTLVTIHVALAEVPRFVTEERVLETIRLTREGLIARAGIADPSIAVLGLNPHASEEGLFGDEEARRIAPAVAAAARRGWRVQGPFPADSFFFRQAGRHDAVLAMYHDQGLIPVKLLSGGRAVNVTLGLPFLRTSVDHGTAFDIAGRGVASEESLLAALTLAADWTAKRR
ncbi:MAG: 4-hydroxythreonine-4-phosphate dehydrogenase PdxA [Candidatus Eiseniibacteriota bacterium]